ncbi:MAG TPA: SdrD B-like domain-containing protein [Roseiflexaceae bacterium]|nr:SdrD B-like domain-containing protein [Roseiflexaceae bacterium]
MRRYVFGLLSLLCLLIIGFMAGLPGDIQAQIDNQQPGRPYASVINCIRSGSSNGSTSEVSPRFAVTCFGTAWDISYYGQPGGDPLNGDAPGSDPAVVGIGDGKPDAAGVEPGKIPHASLQQVGAVYGLAYSSGLNPAAPAAANGLQAQTNPRQARLFIASFSKRLTRFGPGGPGAIYAHGFAGGTTGVFVTVPHVVPGPAMPLLHAGGAFSYTPGDGSLSGFPNSMAYTAEMGGIHRIRGDAQLEQFASRTSLGDIALDPQERYLYAVNLNNRRIYRFDTWASNPQASMGLLPDLIGLLAPCAARGGTATYRPFGLLVTREYLYLGGACSDEFDTGSDRNDVALRIDRFNLSNSTWELVTGIPLANYGAQRGTTPAGSGYDLAWQPWRATLPSDAYLMPYPAALAADLAFDEEETLYLGVRDRLGDMGAVRGLPVTASRGYGDLLILPRAANGWQIPATGADPTNDDGTPGGAAGVHHNEALWGALAYVPGRHDGRFGGEIAITGLTPYRTNSAGIYWYDRGRGNPTAREEVYHEGQNGTFAKVSGLGDLELLCPWSAIGNRVWLDADGDGIQDAGEAGMNGVRVVLYAGNDSNYTTPLATVTTADADGDGQGGDYRFYVEPFRSYRVRLEPAQFGTGGALAGYFVAPPDQGGDDSRDSDADQISRGALVAALQRDESYRDLDIGLVPLALASGQLGDLVWEDRNGDGLQQNGEPGLNGVRVRLESCRDLLPTTSCSSWGSFTPPGGSFEQQSGVSGSGGYRFERLPPNYYRIQFIPPANHTATRRDAGDDTRDSDADPASNWRTPATRVTSPGGSLHLDLGLVPAATNVSIGKNGPSTAMIGDLLEFTLNYAVAAGGASATGVVVIDTLPEGMSYVGATPAPTHVNGRVLRWELGTLAAATSGTIRITGRADALGVQFNQATISTTAPGDVGDDNSATVQTIIRRPNLSVSKSGPPTATPGMQVRYLLVVRNMADGQTPAEVLAPAAGVVVEDFLPAGVDFDTATPAPSGISGQQLRWDLGLLGNGETRTIEVYVRVGTTLPIVPALHNRVEVSTTSSGDASSDNSATVVTTVQFPALQISLVDTPDPVGEAGIVRYTLVYANQGNGSAADVQVQLHLPAGTAYRSAVPLPPGSTQGDRVSWNLGTLMAGMSATLTIDVVVAVGSGPLLTAIADISTPTIGDDPADNQAVTTTQVVAAPLPPTAPAVFQIAIHSDLDPLSRDSDPRNAVYRAGGTTIRWPAGEVLDLTPLVRLQPTPLSDEAALLYEQQTTVAGWSLQAVEVNGHLREATAADDLRRSGCRQRDGATTTTLDGCVYRYVAQGSLEQPELPDEVTMARQVHLFFASGLPLQMRRDVYVFDVTQPGDVRLWVQLELQIDTVNRETGMLVRSDVQRRDQVFRVRLVVPRSVR